MSAMVVFGGRCPGGAKVLHFTRCWSTALDCQWQRQKPGDDDCMNAISRRDSRPLARSPLSSRSSQDDHVSLWGIPLIPLMSRYGWQRATAGGLGSVTMGRGVKFVVHVLHCLHFCFFICFYCCVFIRHAFSALTLLVGRHEGHLACKN